MFREKLAGWQENYMVQLNKEYIALLSSEAIWNIVDLIRIDVIKYEDLAEFSDDLKQAVKMRLDRNRG